MVSTLHMWVGAVGCVFILIIAAMGIVLDHRDDFGVKLKILATNGIKIDDGSVLDRRLAIHIDPTTGNIFETPRGTFDIVRWSKTIHAGEGLIDKPWRYDILALAPIGWSGAGLRLFALPYLRRRNRVRARSLESSIKG